MSDWDILFRGAKLVSADDIGTADIAVIGEQIAAVGVNLAKWNTWIAAANLIDVA